MKTHSFQTCVAKMLTLILAFASISLTTSCTKLLRGDTFTTQYNGIAYRCEVLVSHQNYVRIIPVTGPEAVTGAVSLPSTVQYDGHTHIVSQVGANAFNNYTGITSVTLPSTISIIETSAFRNCQALTSVNVPTSISVIGDSAFANCSLLQSFQFVTSISSLGQACFRGCSSLVNVNLPSTITAIPADAFYGCSSITSLHLPSTILQIGDRAFAYCSNLDNIYFDRSVQTIGDSVFMGCNAVQAITCLTATPPACTASTFGTIPVNIPVTVMNSCLANYQNAIGWNRFTNYIGTY
jgi:hypothetical protein